jgi:carboxylesterase
MKNIMQNDHLDGAPFQLIGNRDICIVLVHGFTATPVEVRPLAEFVHQHGYGIIAPLLPGHNTTPEDLNNQKWTDWVREVEQSIDQAKKFYSKVFIGGESMGALICTHIAAKDPELSGVILYAPAFRVKNLWASFALRFIKPFLKKANAGVDDDSPALPGTHPWKGYRVNPTKAAYQMFLLQRITNKMVGCIKQPILILQGTKDTTVDISAIERLYQTISSKTKDLLWYQNSGHCIILDQEYESVFIDSLHFLEHNS